MRSLRFHVISVLLLGLALLGLGSAASSAAHSAIRGEQPFAHEDLHGLKALRPQEAVEAAAERVPWTDGSASAFRPVVPVVAMSGCNETFDYAEPGLAVVHRRSGHARDPPV